MSCPPFSEISLLTRNQFFCYQMFLLLKVTVHSSQFFLLIFPAVECGSLAMPTNGSTYGELTTYPNKVYFNCDEGFVLQGSSIRVCMANGSWSGTETLCEGELDS